jgi:RES domain-containing protein
MPSVDGAARKVPGRWNLRGRALVYTSESRALAALETLVHIERPKLLESAYPIIPAEIPDELVEHLELGSLGPGWNDLSDLLQTQKIGDEWLKSRVSMALCVPSALVPREFNVLLSQSTPTGQR